MNTLKIEPGKKFISIYKEDDYYSYEIYESNDDTKFHIEERDWNFDNDVYPQCIAYFYDSDRCYSIVTIEEFKDEYGLWYTKVGMKSVWTDIPMVGRTSSERCGYITQKPIKLSKRIIELYTNENDVVGDFFCGSGTTMVVAKLLNRKYIGCDINPRAIEITNKRLNTEVM